MGLQQQLQDGVLLNDGSLEDTRTLLKKKVRIWSDLGLPELGHFEQCYDITAI